MMRLLLLALTLSSCAQIQTQRAPAWTQSVDGWRGDGLVCIGHSGPDGGVHAADFAAARCTAGFAVAWLKPLVSSLPDEQAERMMLILMRLPKVSDRWEDPASGEVASRMQLTVEEVDRQLQRELMEQPELLATMRQRLNSGPKTGVTTAPTELPWLQEKWATIKSQKPPRTVAPVAPAENKASVLPKKAEPAKKKAEPAKKKAKPVKKKAEPVKKKAEPVKKKAEPAKKKAEPVKKKAAPAKNKTEPVKKKAEPVKKKAEPATKKAEPKKEQRAKPATKTKEKPDA
jgi:hypothetical protein